MKTNSGYERVGRRGRRVREEVQDQEQVQVAGEWEWRWPAGVEPLPRSFYERDAVTLARALIGQILVHQTQEGLLAGRVVETEAYCGPGDLASHARRGLRTPRNEVMYGPAGHAYIYFIYGMYYCVNVVAAGPGLPQAVLLRAVEPVAGLELMARRRRLEWPVPPPDTASGRRARWLLASGPGRLAAAFALDRSRNGWDLCRPPFCILPGDELPGSDEIVATTRIGVDYAGEWAKRPWRFLWKDNPYVSEPPR